MWYIASYCNKLNFEVWYIAYYCNKLNFEVWYTAYYCNKLNFEVWYIAYYCNKLNFEVWYTAYYCNKLNFEIWHTAYYCNKLNFEVWYIAYYCNKLNFDAAHRDQPRQSDLSSIKIFKQDNKEGIVQENLVQIGNNRNDEETKYVLGSILCAGDLSTDKEKYHWGCIPIFM